MSEIVVVAFIGFGAAIACTALYASIMAFAKIEAARLVAQALRDTSK